jgi:hypothetical protein
MNILQRFKNLSKTQTYIVQNEDGSTESFDLEIRALPIHVYRELVLMVADNAGDPDSTACLHGVFYLDGSHVFNSIQDVHSIDQGLVASLSADVFELSTQQLSQTELKKRVQKQQPSQQKNES